MNAQLTCMNCGNQETFRHIGHGWERRHYDSDTGECLGVSGCDITTEETQCTECKSKDVRYQ